MIFITPFLVLIGVCECMHEGVCVFVCLCACVNPKGINLNPCDCMHEGVCGVCVVCGCVFVCVRESEGYKFEPMQVSANMYFQGAILDPLGSNSGPSGSKFGP